LISVIFIVKQAIFVWLDESVYTYLVLYFFTACRWLL